MKHHNPATFINQKVVIQNFIIEQTNDEYFSKWLKLTFPETS